MALLLRDVVGLSYTEIADSLEITLATVKWRIFKAREEVQLALEREGIEVEVSRQPVAARDARGSARRRARAGRPGPRAARARGSPACVLLDVVLDAAERRRPAPRGRAAARPPAGRVSRGWPTEPGLRSQRSPASSSSVPSRCRARASSSESRKQSATWLWPTRTSSCGAAASDAYATAEREDVLPDRVARARVEEADAFALAARLERLEVRARPPARGPRPSSARADGRVGREDLEVEPPEDGEVVVSYQADVRPLGHDGAAAVRARAVADEVAQAPDLVGRVPVDRLEHRLEGMEVPVDVRDDGDAHSRRTLAKGLALAALAALWVAAAALLWRTEVPDLDAAEPRSRATTSRRPSSTRIDDYRRVLAPALPRRGRRRDRSCSRSSSGRRGRSPRGSSALGRGRVRTSRARRPGRRARRLAVAAAVRRGQARPPPRLRALRRRAGAAGSIDQLTVARRVQAVLVSIAVAGAVWLAGPARPALVARRRACARGDRGRSSSLAQPLVVQPLFNRFEPLPATGLAARDRGARRGDGRGRRRRPRRRREPAHDDGERLHRGHRARRGASSSTTRSSTAASRTARSATSPRTSSAHVERRHLWKGLAWFALLAVPGRLRARVDHDRRGGLGAASSCRSGSPSRSLASS